MDLCLQGSGDLHICSSQTEWSITQILVFLDDLLMFLSGMWCEFDVMCFCCKGMHVY